MPDAAEVRFRPGGHGGIPDSVCFLGANLVDGSSAPIDDYMLI